MAVKRIRWIPFSHSSPPFRTGLSAKAGNNSFEIDFSRKTYWSIGKVQLMLNQSADISGHERARATPFNFV
jgi:hypothetical protein